MVNFWKRSMSMTPTVMAKPLRKDRDFAFMHRTDDQSTVALPPPIAASMSK